MASIDICVLPPSLCRFLDQPNAKWKTEADRADEDRKDQRRKEQQVWVRCVIERASQGLKKVLEQRLTHGPCRQRILMAFLFR